MIIFKELKVFAEFEKKNFPFIETVEDRAIIIAIGDAQSRDEEITAKQLHQAGIGSQATIERRLARMKKMSGVIRQKRSKEDKRNVILTLCPRVIKSFKEYEMQMIHAFSIV